MQPSALVLRDIHQPAAPFWWPPAPGWWIVLVIAVAALVAVTWWRRRRRLRRAAVERVFDDAIAAAGTPSASVAAASDLLRRAARRSNAQADRLQGAAWLRFLDGTPPRSRGRQPPPPHALFSDGPGRLLLDGGFRRDVAEADLSALLPLARRRYLQLMGQVR